MRNEVTSVANYCFGAFGTEPRLLSNCTFSERPLLDTKRPFNENLKMRFSRVVFAILFFVFPLALLPADSPLTSTPFAEAYSDVPIVSHALGQDGTIDITVIEYLSDLNEPLDVKVAAINALGWNYDGQENSLHFFGYIFDQHIGSTDSAVRKMNDGELFDYSMNFIANMNGEHLLCFAYLMAMDDYFDVSVARMFASLGADLIDRSYTAEIIRALIHAQHAMSGDWCTVFRIVDDVNRNNRLKKDMRPEAVEIIMSYIDRYSSYCD
jgi:hypothetical protein